MIVGAQAAGTPSYGVPAGAHALIGTAVLGRRRRRRWFSPNVGSAGAGSQPPFDRARHPPARVSGMGPATARPSRRAHWRSDPRAPSIWVQIESTDALSTASTEIVSVPNIDAAVVGHGRPFVLTWRPARYNTPEMTAAAVTGCWSRVLSRRGRRARRRRRIAMPHPPTLRAAASILVHSTDARLCAGAVDQRGRRGCANAQHSTDGAHT